MAARARFDQFHAFFLGFLVTKQSNLAIGYKTVVHNNVVIGLRVSLGTQTFQVPGRVHGSGGREGRETSGGACIETDFGSRRAQ